MREGGFGWLTGCTATCKDGSAMKRYKAKNSYHVGSDILFWKRVEDIQNEIMTNGPVETYDRDRTVALVPRASVSPVVIGWRML